jgi:hypothetical protein
MQGRLSVSRAAGAPLRSATTTLAVAVCLIAGALLVAAAPAGATAAWSIVPSPRPPGYAPVVLNGVSCPSPTNCFAVGYAYPPNTGLINPLVEHWNGHAWSIMTSPKPRAADSSYLNGVSCSSTTSCFAVGYSQFGSAPYAYKTLVERLVGHQWSIVTSPNPTGSANSFLNAVSCRGTSCFAVGFTRLPHSRTLVEHWAGNSWSIVTSPNPAGSRSASLGGVSCPSTTSCFAAGSADFSSGYKTLMEHWNGHTWSVLTSPTLTSAGVGTLSCSTTTSCFAVGSYFGGGVDKSLVERWNGHTWSIITSPNPAGATGTVLVGVSCPTPTHCFAVGESSYEVFFGKLPYGTTEKTLVESWDGHAWSIMRSRNPSPGGFRETVLNGVSCHRAASCFAVGDFGGIPSASAWSTTNLTERYE